MTSYMMTDSILITIWLFYLFGFNHPYYFQFLVDSYKSGDIRIRNLLEFGRVHILPSLNPDGFKLALNFSKWGGANQCVSGHGR